jgi:quinol monooxygenase YgiN
VLIATLTFEVRPDKRVEVVGAVIAVVQVVRWSTGCLGCRLVTDCENDNVITLISEWDNRSCLDRFIASPEFQILEGTRFLLQDGPSFGIDEVISRGRQPSPVSHLR